MIDSAPYIQPAIFSEAALPDGSLDKPTAPKIECTIRMRSWCLVGLSYKIELMDYGIFRSWKISDSTDFIDGPIKIIENKKCDSPADFLPKKLSDHLEGIGSSQKFTSVVYALNKSQSCTLKIEFPVEKSVLKAEYKQFVLFRIILCKNNDCNFQLYKLE